MTLSDLAALGSFVSGLAVLVSLVFLWFQLRQMNHQVKQSEKNQRAQIRQVHSIRIGEVFMRRADHCELWAKAYKGDPLNEAEIYHVIQSMSAVFFGIEDGFYQYRDGLLDEAAWQASLAGLKQALRSPLVRVAWPIVRPSAVGTDFVAMVDKLIAETQPISYSDALAQASASLLREMQEAQSNARSPEHVEKSA